MSEPNAPTPPGADDLPFEAAQDLQFEQAEYTTTATAGPICGLCNQPIAARLLRGRRQDLLRNLVEGESSNRFAAAPELGRVLKAVVFGTGTAVGRRGALLCDHPDDWMEHRPDRRPRGNHGRTSRPGRHREPRRPALPVSRRLPDLFDDRGHVRSLWLLIEGFKERPKKESTRADAVAAKNDADRAQSQSFRPEVQSLRRGGAQGQGQYRQRSSNPDAPSARATGAQDAPKKKIAPHKDKDKDGTTTITTTTQRLLRGSAAKSAGSGTFLRSFLTPVFSIQFRSRSRSTLPSPD